MRLNLLMPTLVFTRRFIGSLVIILLMMFICQQHGIAATLNGFDLSDSLIPAKDIFHGGPPRDGIPAIDEPKFISPAEVNFLTGEDRVLGLNINGEARAYPVRIMDYHEIVNDRFGGQAVVVTYCPLCGTGIAFDARVNGELLSFGVSGLLYNSDVLLYDRQSESLWSQILGRAVTGSARGEKLTALPMEHTTWADWLARYPDTRVLSSDTGYRRDYSTSPYQDYATSPRLYFPVTNTSTRYHPKERVIGLEYKGQFKAYPFVELAKSGEGVITDEVMGELITVRFNAESRSGTIFDSDGRELPSFISFWFAWVAFHPETAVYQK